MIKMKNHNLLFILIYLLLVGLSEQTECSSGRNLLKFHNSSEYVYLYEIDTLANVNPNDKLKPSSLNFKSEIKIRQGTNCDYELKFDKIQYDLDTKELDSTKEHIKQILESPFHFKIIDGEIKDLNFDFNLNDERLSEWIKKLYENLFITIQLPLNEDVEQSEEVTLTNKETFDQCTVNYLVKTKRKSFFAIKSTKNLANCLKLKHPKLINKFLINSNQECSHLIKDNVLIEVLCTENNKANLFHVVQVINTKLKFLKTVDQQVVSRQEKGDSSLAVQINKTLDANLVESSKHLLNEICHHLKVEINPKLTQPLASLARNIRELNYNQLIEITEHANQIEECKNKQQFNDIVNSLIFQSTGNAAAIQYLLKNVDQPTDMFYSLLAFSERPTEEAVRLIIPKLDQQLEKLNTSYQPILGITSFLGNFCERENCEKDEQIIRVQQKMVERLGKSCSNEQHRILLLKCIKNIGILDQMLDQVLPCLELKEESITRLTTIQLLDKISITHQRVINKLNAIFSDPSEESELRINAFLILVKALEFDPPASSPLKNDMIKQLQQEHNPQVLSFVHSYLKNLKDDSYGLKEMMNSIKKDKQTENVFLYSKNLSPNFLKNDLLDGELDINLIRNNQHQLVNANLKGEVAPTSDEKQTIEIGFMQSGLNDLINKFINEMKKKSVNLQGTFQEMLNLVVSLRRDKESIQTMLDTMISENERKHEELIRLMY